MEVRHEKSRHHTDCLLGELRNELVDHFAFSAIFFLKKSRQIKTSEADTVHARSQLKAHISRTTFAADTMLAAKNNDIFGRPSNATLLPSDDDNRLGKP